jgi:rare lipoprotein A
MNHINRIGIVSMIALISAAAIGLPNQSDASSAASSSKNSMDTSTSAPKSSVIREPVVANPKLDLSGHKRVGVASFYANEFAGRKMADGTRMDPQGDNAASKTLPLGTTAKVTNLQTGESAVVTIKDRGPYVKGRIVDLSPSTARKIGIAQSKGLAQVEVSPITVPLPDGGVIVGEALRVASAQRQLRLE